MNDYPPDWDAIAARIKAQAGNRCERCKEPNCRDTWHVLTVHHLDGNKANCEDWNLAALCQRCHLAIQARVTMAQMFFEPIIEVSDWFKPHLAGFLAARAKRHDPQKSS